MPKSENVRFVFGKHLDINKVGRVRKTVNPSKTVGLLSFSS